MGPLKRPPNDMIGLNRDVNHVLQQLFGYFLITVKLRIPDGSDLGIQGQKPTLAFSRLVN